VADVVPAGGPVLVYLAHPVGAPDRAGVEAHLAAAGRWLRWFVELPGDPCRRIAWCLPWLAYAHALPDVQPYRERGLRDGGAALERCDAIVAVARQTPGVNRELAQAAELGLPSLNLVAAGLLPPSTNHDGWWASGPAKQVIDQLAELVRAVDRRRDRCRTAAVERTA
jgi:hypothetical protein